MKQLFYIGQKVTPIEKRTWYVVSGFAPPVDIKFGDVVTVSGYDPKPDASGKLYIYLEEMPTNYSFAQHRFGPVMGDGELAEELKEIFPEVLESNK